MKTEFGKVKESCMFSVDCMCQEMDEFWCRDIQRMYTGFAALKTYLETGETPSAFNAIHMTIISDDNRCVFLEDMTDDLASDEAFKKAMERYPIRYKTVGFQ